MHVAQRAEIVRIGHARVAGEERIGAEHIGRADAVNQLRHDAVVQRRRIEECRHAGEQRQHDAAHEAERVKRRQRVEQPYRRGQNRCARPPARRSTSTLRWESTTPFGTPSGPEVNKTTAQSSRLARHQRPPRPQRAEQLIGGGHGLAYVFQINKPDLTFEHRRSASPSRPFSTKAVRGRGWRRSARLGRRASTLAAPAVKLTLPGTRPADCRASTVTAAPFDVGSMHADGFRRRAPMPQASHPRCAPPGIAVCR